ncbi:hypothetical protein C6P52_09625 [Enterococcus mundtii]|uniref:hypothetical protein n=1 Tax=Enterococcus mundtii TaxID=53346 RepID=UPI000D390C09|nr:hypothetical protein [Enterococcus mundtii]PTO38326.1 hypothetical protein C6P52_09625 [Enterococcus mundtii]PTO43042.1 hypothetical protein C6P54_10955 [Enterococcus mundtii]
MIDEEIRELGEKLLNKKDLSKEDKLTAFNYMLSHYKIREDHVIDGLEDNFVRKEDSFNEAIDQPHREQRFRPIKQIGRAIQSLWRRTWGVIRGSRQSDRIALNKEQIVTTNNNEQRSKEGINRSDSTTSRTKHANTFNDVKVGDSLHSPQRTKKSIGAVKESPIYFTRKIRSANEVAQAVNTALTKKVDHPVSKERR